jgi:hypothetical protein
MERQSFLGDRMGYDGTLRKPIEFIRCWASYSEDINDSELDEDDNKLEALDKESYNNFHGFADKPMVYAQVLLRPDEFSVPPVNMLTRKDETLKALLCWTGLRYMYIIYSESAFCIRDRLEEEIMKVEIFDNHHWITVKDRLLLNML